MREPTEMELRVAREMYDANPALRSGHLAWDQLSFGYQAPWIACARSAIGAIREPTADMIARGDSRFYVGREQSRAIWQAMIDAASPPDSGEG